MRVVLSLLAVFFVFECAADMGRAEDAAKLAEIPIPDSLEKFVRKPEPAYRWEHKHNQTTNAGRIHHLHLVSQTWHDITWEHALFVYEPAQIDHPEHMLLFVSGGGTGRLSSDKDKELGLKLAAACGAPVAFLSQVPNQPLLDNRKEDDLITETWLRYLNTGDETWPLLFPMVKSAVQAMDALQEFSEQHLSQRAKSFVITGASKRGWTSWLTPVVDPRIVGTAPIVIDVLNFMAQMKNQKATWGKYSEQIIDYTSKGLVKTSEEEESPRERQLRIMMDPHTYREKLALPKLMIVGTNDRYWVVDAMNIYWDDLIGPKYVLQVPNAGHDLGDGKEHALNTLSIFFKHLATGQSLPKLDWKTEENDGVLTLHVEADPAPVSVKLWSATAEGNDFRESRWESQPLKLENGKAQGAVPLPTAGRHAAMFGELEFRMGERSYSLTTLVYRK
jgi:PhoPQ-activated pathogenicity-related protein